MKPDEINTDSLATDVNRRGREQMMEQFRAQSERAERTAAVRGQPQRDEERRAPPLPPPPPLRQSGGRPETQEGMVSRMFNQIRDGVVNLRHVGPLARTTIAAAQTERQRLQDEILAADQASPAPMWSPDVLAAQTGIPRLLAAVKISAWAEAQQRQQREEVAAYERRRGQLPSPADAATELARCEALDPTVAEKFDRPLSEARDLFSRCFAAADAIHGKLALAGQEVAKLEAARSAALESEAQAFRDGAEPADAVGDLDAQIARERRRRGALDGALDAALQEAQAASDAVKSLERAERDERLAARRVLAEARFYAIAAPAIEQFIADVGPLFTDLHSGDADLAALRIRNALDAARVEAKRVRWRDDETRSASLKGDELNQRGREQMLRALHEQDTKSRRATAARRSR